jgi:hypothetical protein
VKNLLSAVAISIFIAGCATALQPSIPVGYTGPTAVLKDTSDVLSGRKANLFFADAIDANKIENSEHATFMANQGRGMNMVPKVIERPIPARPLQIELVGRTEYAAPILALTGTVYQVKGIVEFTPEAGKTYSVHGELGENYSAVWIEEDLTKTVVAKKIEVKGSAALSVMEK